MSTPLVVPAEFNRNSATVTALMPPEESGLWLLERMRQQVGFDRYDGRTLLDFGCGVRFAQAILASDFRIARYCGVDNFLPMIEFLQKNVSDPRFSFHFLNAYHPLYNQLGKVLTEQSSLPVAECDFDLVSMFSVITHQYPAYSRAIFTMLRRHVAADGRLFFTCFLDDAIETFADRSPERNGGRCFYNRRFLTELVEASGWRVTGSAPAEGPLIADSFVCAPV